MSSRTLTWKAPIKARDLEQGLVWVECYLPLDLEALGTFEKLAQDLGQPGQPDYQAAATADPELAAKALDPIDTHGEAMMADDVQQLAHVILTEGGGIDVMHDQVATKTAALVESFINGPEIASPHFAPGAWCAVIKVDQAGPEWPLIEAGELNAVSFMAVVSKVAVRVALPNAQPTEVTP